MTIGEKIKEIRKKNHLTQRQFGSFVGISDAHVSNIESGKDNPSKSLLRLICTKFGINESSFGQDSDIPPEMGFYTIGTLKERFNELLEDNNLSLDKLAAELGLSETYSIAWGEPSIDLHELIKISDYFDVSLDWLIKGVEHPIPYSYKNLDDEETTLLNKYRQLKKDEKVIINSLLDKLTAKRVF